ncbi:hypothetical protein Patl1_15347 [Pistacia atlantica]|uniref:Uncharacterized protein n=1 Tax=Pistacia atlantica TaxID=434234 RepID=A0ACC1B6D0_9ROSI|nr:hypothetical protein Patl1_15347 [Pistacia atlantica]
MEAARELTELRRRQAFEKNLTLETKYMAAEGYVESTRADLRKQALKLLVQVRKSVGGMGIIYALHW